MKKIIHEKLHQSEDISKIEVNPYLHELLETVFSNFYDRNVDVEIDAADIALETNRAIPLGLIVNEIATNAIKHGFNEREAPRFTVEMNKDEQMNLNTITFPIESAESSSSVYGGSVR